MARSPLLAAQWEVFLAERLGADAAVWETPPLFGMKPWLVDLWTEAQSLGTPSLGAAARGSVELGRANYPAASVEDLLLTPLQSAVLWREVVRQSPLGQTLIGPAAAGRLAARAWELLCHWRIDPSALDAGPAEPQFGAFLSWARAYASRLRDEGWTDRAAMLAPLSESAAQLKARTVRMLDPPPLTPAEHCVIESLRAQSWQIRETRSASAQHGRSSRDAPAAAAPGGARALGLGDPADELRAAAAWVSSRLERDPAARIALVVPDLDRRVREIIATLERSLGDGAGAAGLWLEHGFPLAAVPAIGAALTALDVLSPAGTVAQLSRWLRSPFFGVETPDERSACAMLEARLRRDLRTELPFLEAYRTGLAEVCRADIPHRADGLERAVAAMSGLASLTPTDWVNAWQRALIGLGWLADASLGPADTRDAWEGALAELAELTPIVGAVSGRRARDELRAILERRRALGRIPRAGLCVLSRLDAVGPGYDGIWVAGFTDRRWPEPVAINPLLPRRLQVVHGMPGTTPALALAGAESELAELVASCPEVVLSWPAAIADQPVEPSRLLRRVHCTPANDAPELPGRQAGAAAIEELADSAPALGGATVKGGVRVLDLQAACPIRAFCETRLGAAALDPLAPGLSPRLQGKVVHRALSFLFGAARDAGRFDSEALGQRVPDLVQRALAEAFGPARAALDTLFRLEQRRLERMLLDFIARESERLPFVPRDVERAIDVAVGAWSLAGRIDRIDALPDGRVAVIDYKTAPGFKAAHWFQPRLLDCQLPLYATALEAEGARVAALVVVELETGRIEYRGVGDGIAARFRALGDSRTWERQIGEWRTQLLTLLEEYAGGDVRVLARDPTLALGAYAPLTRVYEQLGDAEGAAQT